MDAMTVISNNYSKVVTQYNKIIRMNECLKKENKDIQAQKYHVLKAYEKLKLFAIRQNRKLINDSRMRGDGNNVIISDFCEESQSCCSSTKTAVIDEQTIEISTDTCDFEKLCDSEKLSECSVESDSSVCDSLSQLMRDIELICGTKTACNAHVELITQLKNTVINAMQLDQSNEATLNKQQEEINHYIQQIDDLKNKNECKAIDISKMKQNISELADALEGQYLENKKLKSYNVDQCCIIDEYLNTQQVLECKLSQAENQCNDLTIYSTQLENNLKEEHNENCEKADIICNLQEQLQDYNSKLDEFHDEITLSANEIVKFKEEHCTLNNTIDALKENNSILKIELKCVGLKLNNSIELENIRFDENEILKKNVKNLETALEIFKCENNSLVEKSIKDRLEVLWSIIKIHISENEKKHYEENITELNNFIECAATKYSNIQKEIEICNSKLLKTTEDNKVLQLQLMEVRKNLDIACKNLKCAQQQLLDTKDKEESAIMMQSKKIESISSIYTQTEIPSSFETISVIGKYSSTIISETEISNCTERIPLTVIKIDVPKIVSRTEISDCTESELFCTEPLAVIETDVPKTVSRTEISNNTEPILSVIKTDLPKIVSRTEISNNTKPILSVIETESTDVQRGQSPKVNKIYEENGLSESNSNEKEIAQMCLESETNKNLQINNCMTSKLVDTRIQKRISKLAASPSYPKLRFKSNIPIQKTCTFPLDISSSSESNGFVTSCTCSNNSCEPKCDCIESYIKKSEKQLPDELHKVERKEKQYKSRIYDNDLQNSHKNPSSTDTYDAHMRYCNISLENVEKYTASVSNNVDNTSPKAKGDQLKNINSLQEMSHQNINENYEDISPKTKGDELENANALQEMSQNINENREEMSQNINENREDQTMKKHEVPGLAKQNSIEQVKTTKLKLQKQKTKQTKKPKKKIMSSKTSQKPEFRYNLPCTSCNDENCYYNKTAPKNLEECQIFLKQIMTRRKK